jgi:hypothetical protein
MVAPTEPKVSKTAFVTDYLGKNPTATWKAVNRAWTEAGQAGSISETLVSRRRSELGLIGNAPRGRAATAASNAMAGVPKAPRGGATGKKRGRRPRALTNGVHNAEPAPERRARPGDRDLILTEIEADIDRLIFRLMMVGGLEEIEEDLRSVRRRVTRSHKA